MIAAGVEHRRRRRPGRRCRCARSPAGSASGRCRSTPTCRAGRAAGADGEPGARRARPAADRTCRGGPASSSRSRRRWQMYARHPWLLDLNMARMPVGPHVLDADEALYAALSGRAPGRRSCPPPTWSSGSCSARPAPRSSKPTRPATPGPRRRPTGSPGPASGRPTSTTALPDDGRHLGCRRLRRPAGYASTGCWPGCWTGIEQLPRPARATLAARRAQGLRGERLARSPGRAHQAASPRCRPGNTLTGSPGSARSPASCRSQPLVQHRLRCTAPDPRVVLQLGLRRAAVRSWTATKVWYRMLLRRSRSGSPPPGRRRQLAPRPSTPGSSGHTASAPSCSQVHEPAPARGGARRRGTVPTDSPGGRRRGAPTRSAR